MLHFRISFIDAIDCLRILSAWNISREFSIREKYWFTSSIQEHFLEECLAVIVASGY